MFLSVTYSSFVIWKALSSPALPCDELVGSCDLARASTHRTRTACFGFILNGFHCKISADAIAQKEKCKLSNNIRAVLQFEDGDESLKCVSPATDLAVAFSKR